jgi:hypothetical protein
LSYLQLVFSVPKISPDIQKDKLTYAHPFNFAARRSFGIPGLTGSLINGHSRRDTATEAKKLEPLASLVLRLLIYSGLCFCRPLR